MIRLENQKRKKNHRSISRGEQRVAERGKGDRLSDRLMVMIFGVREMEGMTLRIGSHIGSSFCSFLILLSQVPSFLHMHTHSFPSLLPRSHPFAHTQKMYSAILAGNRNNSDDGYNHIAPPPPLLSSLPLYLRFVLSQQTHLLTLSNQKQEDNLSWTRLPACSHLTQRRQH